jgi:hypothetical protein
MIYLRLQAKPKVGALLESLKDMVLEANPNLMAMIMKEQLVQLETWELREYFLEPRWQVDLEMKIEL